MGIPEGTYRLGPRSGRLLVRTARTGLGARAGHDLLIEVTDWEGTVVVHPGGPAASSVRLAAEVGSFEVRAGTGGVKPLTGADRAEIKRTLTGILRADQHPVISFVSTAVTGGPDSFRVEGDLTIAGVTQPVTVHGTVAGNRVQGSATVTQSRWGIKPYSAFFGALKLRDDVAIEFDVTMDTDGQAPGSGPAGQAG